MTSFARILAALMGSFMFYILWNAGKWDTFFWFLTIVALTLIIYSLIGHKLKGEGNIFTEDLAKAMKRDFNIIIKKDDKN
jgi:hypothetical protein